MNNSKSMQLKLLACAVISISLGVGTMTAYAADGAATVDRPTQTSGPTGTPTTTGDGGSADTTGEIWNEDQVDGGMAGVDTSVDKIDADDFLEQASAKGVAEIKTAKDAVEKTSSAEVKAFAQMMIKDHTAANEKMAELAKTKGLKISDEATLLDKAKGLILEVRDGDSFDAAYANNQVAAHQDTIELFAKAARSDDAQVAAFAKETLPKLKEHLRKAKELVESTPTP